MKGDAGMQELKVIGIEQGSLLAASDDGARFRIVIDDVLISRLRQAQPEIPHDSRLSPREIQTRIRGGMSAEDVAEVTGAPVEYIQRFEGPVLAEREHIVNSALAVSVHMAHDPDPEVPMSFGAAIRDRLAALSAEGERWASWKDDERGWIVKLEFRADTIDHDARWLYDPRRQALKAINAEAITLSQQGELKDTLIPRLRAVDPEDERARFDSAAFAFEVPAPSVEDTAPQVEAQPATPPRNTETSSQAASRAAVNREQEPEEQPGGTADLLETLRRRRGQRQAAAQSATEPQPAGAPQGNSPQSFTGQYPAPPQGAPQGTPQWNPNGGANNLPQGLPAQPQGLPTPPQGLPPQPTSRPPQSGTYPGETGPIMPGRPLPGQGAPHQGMPGAPGQGFPGQNVPGQYPPGRQGALGQNQPNQGFPQQPGSQSQGFPAGQRQRQGLPPQSRQQAPGVAPPNAVPNQRQPGQSQGQQRYPQGRPPRGQQPVIALPLPPNSGAPGQQGNQQQPPYFPGQQPTGGQVPNERQGGKNGGQKRGGRASMPSWDEIVFGARPDDEPS